MKKGIILAAILGVVALFGTVFALNPTVFTDLKATNFIVTTIYDSSSVARIAPGSTNTITGNATVTGNGTITGNLTTSGTSYFTVTMSSAPRDSSSTGATNVVGLTPIGKGQIAYNTTDSELCVSTGSTRFTWIEISTTAVVPCRH